MSYPCRTCHTKHRSPQDLRALFDPHDRSVLKAMIDAISCRAEVPKSTASEAALAALDAIRLDHCIEPKPKPQEDA